MDVLDAAKEIVKANAGAIYKDSAQPSVRVVGKALAQCTSLFVTPIGKIAEISEKNILKYLNKLKNYKEDEIVSPDTRILVPILERMRYTDDDLVSDYYAQILATASVKSQAKKVAVTFIEILNRLSADELKILEFINSLGNVTPIKKFSTEESKKYKMPESTGKIIVTGGFPVIDIHVMSDGKEGFRELLKNFNLIPDLIKLSAPENIGIYLDNLISLGLMKKEFGKHYVIKNIYTYIEEHSFITKLKSQISPGEQLKFDHGKIDLSVLALGLLRLGNDKKNPKQGRTLVN